jgi:hypothetical protein
MRIPTNDYLFFIGESLCDPLSDKLGTWRLTLSIRSRMVADESFEIVELAPQSEEAACQTE